MMWKQTLLLVLWFIQGNLSAVLGPRAGCSVSINRDLSEPQPLVLKANRYDIFDPYILPVDNSGTLSFDEGEQFDLACPNGNLLFGGSSSSLTIATATCVSGTTFTINSANRGFSSITCSSYPFHTARYTGSTCDRDGRQIEIGFEVGSTFLPSIHICFDSVGQNSLYSTFNLTRTIGGYQVGFPRPSFIQGSFYSVGTPNVDSLYTRARQRITINNLIGLNESDTTYVHATNDYFLARGHLTAKADFVYGALHRLTFYFVNVAPQWQTFNGGNWNTLEDNVRTFASNRDLDLVVYTGTYGVTTLPHATTGQDVELYLYVNGNNKGLPVPALYWKVVYEPIARSGIVFLGVNNPYHDSLSQNLICTDISDRISWVTWKATDQKLGYSYACTVPDFRRVVDYLPSFQVNSVLL